MGTCKVERPRWLSLVLRAVGLMGEGEIGVRRSGDFGARLATGATGTARASFGLAARASILVPLAICCLSYTRRARMNLVSGPQGKKDEKKYWTKR